MATDWIMVRVSRSTHARLDAVRKSMQLAADVGLRELVLDPRDRVSLDQIIGLLIDMREGHAERRRASAARRRKRRREESAAQCSMMMQERVELPAGDGSDN